jgi:hypothetical protein
MNTTTTTPAGAFEFQGKTRTFEDAVYMTADAVASVNQSKNLTPMAPTLMAAFEGTLPDQIQAAREYLQDKLDAIGQAREMLNQLDVAVKMGSAQEWVADKLAE